MPGPAAVTYTPLPYVRDNSIAEVLRLRGQHAADAERQHGDLIGQMFARLGEQVSNSILSYQKEKQEAPIRAQEATLREQQINEGKATAATQQTTLQTNKTIDDLMKQALITDPTSGATTYDRPKLQQGFAATGIGHLWPQYSELLDKSDASLKTLKETHRAAITDVAKLVDASGNDATVFANELMRGVKNGLFTQAEAAPYFEAAQRDPAHVGKITAAILGKKPELLTVNPGDSVVDKDNPAGGAVFTAPESAVQKATRDQATANAAETQRHNRAMEARPVAGAAVTYPGDFTLTGDEFLKTIPLQSRKTVEKIAKYDEDPTKVVSMRGADREKVMAWVNQVNPAYDSSMFSNRAPTRKAYTTGAQGKQITSLNTVIGHLDQIVGIAEKLNNSDFVPGNRAFNALRTMFGADTVTNFDGLKDAVAGEVAGVLANNGATVDAVKEARGRISAASSPPQLAGFVKTLIPVMGSKLSALDYTYHQAMGADDPFKALSPESERILTKHGFDPSHPTLTMETPTSAASGPQVGSTVTLKDGRTVTIKKLNADGTFEY